MPATKLKSEGGFFGWVLRLVQERKARPAEFKTLVEEVVHHLETMPTASHSYLESGRCCRNAANVF